MTTTIHMFNQDFSVSVSGDITCERPRVSSYQLDEVRLAAADSFLNEHKPGLSKPQRAYWGGVRRKSEPPYAGVN